MTAMPARWKSTPISLKPTPASFSNLIGCVYRKGNLIFSPDGNSILSPVGNKISIFDLKNNKSETLPAECSHNITALALSPAGNVAIAVDEDGQALFISLISKSVIHRHHFHERIHSVSFSPNGKKFAIAQSNSVVFYITPGQTPEMNPFVVDKRFNVMHGETTCIDWTSDSSAICVGSKDMNTYVIGSQLFENLKIKTVGGHKDCIVGCYFEQDSLDLYTMSELGELCVWECDTELDGLVPFGKAVDESSEDESSSDEEQQKEGSSKRATLFHSSNGSKKTKNINEKTERKIIYYDRKAKHNFKSFHESQHVRLTSSAYNKKTHILVTGFENGLFCIHEMPEFNCIQYRRTDNSQSISSMAINGTGDWIAVGCASLGQLLVWEWQSDSYIMKQQGHAGLMNCLAYSPDGLYIATGGEDGKVKLWNTFNSFCFVTLSDSHTAAVTGVAFTPNGQAVVSSSLDGTCRAVSLVGYRNFRTFTAPERTSTQFSSLALDYGGKLVCAGSQDNYAVYLWSMDNGRLLEILAGHEGVVTGLMFSPTDNILVSGSWDHTVRIWSICGSKGAREVIQLFSDVLAVAFRPDGQQLAVATLDGQITFWHPSTAEQTRSIEGRHDLGYTRKEGDKITAKKSALSKSFRSLCYTADGSCLLAGGDSKNICIYSIENQILLKKFELTGNLSLDGTLEFLDRRKMTEWGSLALVDDDTSTAISLPGVRKGEFSSRFHKPEVRVTSVQFSPTGLSWAAATTEGLLVYSLNHNNSFDPYQLMLDITPESIIAASNNKDYVNALMMAFRLNEHSLIQMVIEKIPASISATNNEDIILHVCSNLAETYIDKLITFVSKSLEETRHIALYMIWASKILLAQTTNLKQRSSMAIMASMRLLKKNMKKVEDVNKLVDQDRYSLEYLIVARRRLQQEANKLTPEQNDVEMDDEN